MTLPKLSELRSGPLARMPLPEGDFGVELTLAAMRAVSDDAADEPRVMAAARRVLPPGTPVSGLHGWLAGHVEFRPDPEGAEYLKHPTAMIREIEAQGRALGDCDDRAMLGVAMLRAVGVPAAYVVVASRPDRAFHHVFPAAVLPDGTVFPMDSQEGFAAGEWPPAARTKVYPA